MEITNLYKDFQFKTFVFKLSTEEHTTVAATYERVKSLMTDLSAVAEDQDVKRQLFSLDMGARAEQVKWPTFSGENGEDYFKFKKEFLEASVQNKTSVHNQMNKLRENLRSYAKSLIPDSITSVTRAFEILEHACGDSIRVVMHRTEKLMTVGTWPAEGSKNCYANQVKWIIKVQTYLQELIDLAELNADLSAVIYNREKLSQFLKLFPTFIVDKLVKIPGYSKDKYDKIILKLNEFKETCQNRELIYGSSGPSKQKDSTPKPTTVHTSFPKPQNNDSCRVCKVLQAQGENGLFVNHISDVVTGCPKFAALGNEQRLVVSKEAKLCLRCMGKDVMFNRSHSRDFPVAKKKAPYSCRAPNCSFHMWICNKHHDENKEAMERFGEQLRSKAGFRLVHIAVFSDPATSIASPISYHSTNSGGIKKAVKTMKRFNKRHHKEVETLNPPEGTSIFMFLGVQGRTRPVYTFFDSGCSEAIFKTDIPDNELKGTLVTQGPFYMGAVGGTKVVAENEYLVQL